MGTMTSDQIVAIAVAACAGLWLLRSLLVAWWPRAWRVRTPLDEFLTLADLSALGVSVKPRAEAARWKSVVLVGGALVLACGWSFALGTEIVALMRDEDSVLDAWPLAIEALVWCGAAVSASTYRLRTPPFGFALVALVQLIGDASALVKDMLVWQAGQQLEPAKIAHLVEVAVLLLMLGVVLSLPLLDSYVGDSSAPLGAVRARALRASLTAQPSSSAHTAPDDNATLWSWLLFTWITPVRRTRLRITLTSVDDQRWPVEDPVRDLTRSSLTS